MPLTTETPQIVTQVLVDTYEIVSYEVNAQSLQVVIRVRRGLNNAGVVTWVDQIDADVSAAPILNVVPDPGETVYQVTKRLLYQEAVAAGKIPAGTLS